ncbi:hypothetical protein WOLCODRAFT_84404 [Wolfiporia cocos MD-104 SS10]|uniref:Distal membrane-arm assembly complex protein 1-like domain-containing protein n=1 Tax=Wolfiporia cocos (strain MD-104) TaxID=742152 RepID=A0A2H3J7F8_WOLCO|nr:hypothetical protein WOLCODRAFT_84404 [Wolfiporia cocos MD-104 SS10]
MSTSERSASRETVQGHVAPQYQDCLACRVIGTAALGGAGIYALNQSRAHQPGSMVGKRIMAGVGVCEFRKLFAGGKFTVELTPVSFRASGFLVASALRWSK